MQLQLLARVDESLGRDHTGSSHLSLAGQVGRDLEYPQQLVELFLRRRDRERLSAGAVGLHEQALNVGPLGILGHKQVVGQLVVC